MVARGWTRGNDLFNVSRVPVLKDEKSSGVLLHDSVNVLKTLLNCVFKNG